MDSLEPVSFSGTDFGRCHYCYSFYLTPAKLTPLVEKTAKEYLNAEVHF